MLESIWLKQNVSLFLDHITSKEKRELLMTWNWQFIWNFAFQFCQQMLLRICRCSIQFLLSIEHKPLNNWRHFTFYCDLLIKQIDLVTHIWMQGEYYNTGVRPIIVPRIWDASALFIMQVDIRLRTVHRSKCSASRLWNVGTIICLNAIVSHWINSAFNIWLPPANTLWKGNVLIGVCLFTKGRVYIKCIMGKVTW